MLLHNCLHNYTHEGSCVVVMGKGMALHFKYILFHVYHIDFN